MIKNIIVLGIVVSLFSCARVGSPSGGPKDITPPLFLSAKPDTFAINVSENLKEIRIDFDEYVNLKDANKQILISPPLESPPLIYPSGNKARKYVLIKLNEPLNPQTTYNINFGESIEDNNEGNTLAFFNYVISTGDFIDSLRLKGKVTQSLSNKVNLNTVLALYKKDSAEIDFRKKPYYISKIDSSGSYTFQFLHEGNYRLIGFTDENNNLRYDADELIAFSDSLVNPIQGKEYALVLSENQAEYKIISSKQTSQGEIEVIMEGNPAHIDIRSTDDKFPKDFRVNHRKNADTAYVFFDALQLDFKSKERLSFVIQNKDSLDSVSVLYDKKVLSRLEPKLTKKQFTPKDKVFLEISNALQSLNSDSIAVFKDSVSIDFQARIDSLQPKKLYLDFPIQFESNYSIQLNPGALKDYMAQTNDSLSFSFATQTEKDFGNLKLTLQNPPTHPFYLQLMSNDKVIKNIYNKEEAIEFKYLPPGKYTFRILVDENENGVWDKADFKRYKQAEPTFICNSTYEVRAFWDLNETWTLPNQKNNIENETIEQTQ